MSSQAQDTEKYTFLIPRGAMIFAVACCATRINDGATGLISVVSIAYSLEHAIEKAKTTAYQQFPIEEFKGHMFSAVEVTDRLRRDHG